MIHSDILAMIDDGEPRRRALRRRVMLSARLSTSTASYDVTIRDVSATGARVEGQALPGVGAGVMLRRGTFSVYGDLAWREGQVGGVRFEVPLDPDALFESLKGMPSPGSAPAPYRRPGLNRGAHPRFSNGRGWVGSSGR